VQAFIEKQNVSPRSLWSVQKDPSQETSVQEDGNDDFVISQELSWQSSVPFPHRTLYDRYKLAGSLHLQIGDLPLLASAVGLLFLLLLFLPLLTTRLTFLITPVSLNPLLERDSTFFQSPQKLYYDDSQQRKIIVKDFLPYTVKEYTVRAGDTISGIARIFGLSMGTLLSANSIENARRLQAGKIIKIPDQDGIFYRVKKGDSFANIARKYHVPMQKILDKNNLSDTVLKENDVIFLPSVTMDPLQMRLRLGELFLHPLARGRLSSGFGYRPDPFTGVRTFHYGLDLVAAKGSPIIAASEGKVAYVGSDPGGYGNYLILWHNKEFQTLYGHMLRVLVRAGTVVKMGEKIGLVGNTGKSTGAHLHFSIIRNGKFVDPSQYLY